MIEVVCGLIENPSGEFLVCRRPIGRDLGGLWEFPGGKVEDGEDHETAIIRELREELAIEVGVVRAFSPIIWAYPHLQIRLHPYHCKILTGEPQAIEHERLQWCAPADFKMLSWAPADVPIYEELLLWAETTSLKSHLAKTQVI